MMDNKDFKAKLLEYCKNKGISVTNKMTVDTIMSRITEFENNNKKLTETSIFTTDDTTQDNSLEAQAKRLIRCKITCYNPDKNRLGGEIISVGNAVIPEQRKFIAYDKPYHISQLMYNVLKEKTFTRYKRIDTKDKKTTETSYSSLVTLSDNVQVTMTKDKESAWDFKIIIKDKFGTTTYNTVLPKGRFILFVDTKKLSVGVNCFPTKTESLEVNGVQMLEYDEIASW